MGTARGGYYVGGTRVPSVSQVIGQLDKPALVPWAAKLNRQLLVDELAKAEAHDIADLDTYRAFLDQCLASAPTYRTKTSEAADAGTLVHDMILAWQVGDPHTKALEGVTDPGIRQKALTGFESFLSWIEGADFTQMGGEKHLVHPDYMYGGTPDGWGEFGPDKRLGVADWKTGSGIYQEAIIQVAAYAKLVELETGDPVREAHVVRFSRHSATFVQQRVSEEQLDRAWGVFATLLTLKIQVDALKADLK